MLFRVLGPLEIGPGRAAVELGPPKQRAVLAILLMHAGELVTVDRLIDLLWGEHPPRTAAHSIQIYVSELRKALEPHAGRGIIVTRTPGYQLDATPDDVDAGRFATLVARGAAELDAGNRDEAIRTLQAALALWRGSALLEFTYEEFAQPYIRRLHDLHLDALEDLARAELDAGRAPQAIGLLEVAIRDDPLRERSRELLMLALYCVGRQADALRTYERLREALDEDLGLQPSPSLRRLQERILIHDPLLLAADHVDADRPDDVRNPFKGLRPFAPADASDFFGREALVEQLVEAVGDKGLVAVVGPSGSGKSSVVAAGLVPRLLAGQRPGGGTWRAVHLGPDDAGLAELDRILRQAASRQGDGRDRTVVVIDQFEQLFVAVDEDRRRQVLHGIGTNARATTTDLAVLVVLRADAYDRPLLDPAFAEVFIPSVVNVVPMTPRELEAAIVAPAARVGVAVEPALLVELITDSADQPGALPLLQYTLTELFEQRLGSTLTLGDYRAYGGMRGALSRRAERLYSDLDDAQQRIATQVFLRLLRVGRGMADTRRRVSLIEIADLGEDPVALSAVLDAFGRHRLLSFDRDAATGDATVEVAHESLFREWQRLAGWIEAKRAALRRRDSLAVATDEWIQASRSPDYLLTGTRLAEFEPLRHDPAIRLTKRELAFLDASIERRLNEAQAIAGRAAAQEQLERRARRRLAGVILAVVALLIVAVGFGVFAVADRGAGRVALVHPGLGLATSILDDGFDAAVSDFTMVGQRRLVDFPDSASAMRELAAGGAEMIVLFSDLETDVASVADDYPAVRFVLVDGVVEAPNVQYLEFAVQDASYLAGVAAARSSRTGTIAFLGGVDIDAIWPYEAGFVAGARATDPSAQILVDYIAEPPNYGDGFEDPSGARRIAEQLFEDGVDVVFVPAGTAQLGAIEAAARAPSGTGTHRWVIGVDSDQYAALEYDVNAAAWRPHILTSVVKRTDLALYEVLKDFAEGQFTPGRRSLGLADGALDLVYTGGHLESIRPELEAIRAGIESGAIDPPCLTPDRLAGRAPAAACR